MPGLPLRRIRLYSAADAAHVLEKFCPKNAAEIRRANSRRAGRTTRGLPGEELWYGDESPGGWGSLNGHSQPQPGKRSRWTEARRSVWLPGMPQYTDKDRRARLS